MLFHFADIEEARDANSQYVWQGSAKSHHIMHIAHMPSCNHALLIFSKLKERGQNVTSQKSCAENAIDLDEQITKPRIKLNPKSLWASLRTTQNKPSNLFAQSYLILRSIIPDFNQVNLDMTGSNLAKIHNLVGCLDNC